VFCHSYYLVLLLESKVVIVCHWSQELIMRNTTRSSSVSTSLLSQSFVSTLTVMSFMKSTSISLRTHSPLPVINLTCRLVTPIHFLLLPFFVFLLKGFYPSVNFIQSLRKKCISIQTTPVSEETGEMFSKHGFLYIFWLQSNTFPCDFRLETKHKSVKGWMS